MARKHHNPRAVRTEAQREVDLVFIAEMKLERRTLREIFGMINSSRPYRIGERQVCKDSAEVERRWRERANVAIDKAKADEIANIDWTEQEAKLAWKKSKTESAQRTAETSTAGGPKAGGSRSKQKIVTENRDGDPRYLAIVDRCIQHRREIFGIDAPTKTEISGPGGQPIETIQKTSAPFDFDGFLKLQRAMFGIPQTNGSGESVDSPHADAQASDLPDDHGS